MKPKQKRRWVKVEDRLPEVDQDVIIKTKSHGYFRGLYTGHGWMLDATHYAPKAKIEIVAWEEVQHE